MKTGNKLYNIDVVVTTNGRTEIFKKALENWNKTLIFNQIREVIISNDCPQKPLDLDFFNNFYKQSQVRIFNHEENLGFAKNIDFAWKQVERSADFILHLEDDFIFNGRPPIEQMVDVLVANPSLAQMVLKRQPWSQEEKDAGGYDILHGFVNAQADHATRRGNSRYMLHNKFFSSNPSLIPRSVFSRGWRGTEEDMTRHLLEHGFVFGCWGLKGDAPDVHHIGDYRAENWSL